MTVKEAKTIKIGDTLHLNVNNYNGVYKITDIKIQEYPTVLVCFQFEGIPYYYSQSFCEKI